MALSDVKVRSAKPEAKAYKLTDGEGMVLLVTLMAPNTGDFVIVLAVRRRCWRWGNTLKSRWSMPEVAGCRVRSCT
ncbi:DUF4102 domain-containing protein [Escherichia coli]|nr:DUF4102 domain-containing protein [Escherichia coli]